MTMCKNIPRNYTYNSPNCKKCKYLSRQVYKLGYIATIKYYTAIQLKK